MVNSVSNTNTMQQMQQVQQMNQMRKAQGMGQGGGLKGHGLGQLMKSLPQDIREQVRNTLQSLDETQRKDIVSQLKQLDVANLSQDQLLQEVQNILNPTTSAYNFSVYA